MRNPQRLFWDSKNGNMFMSDIGQNIVEEISPVTAGANLGWNVWEGSYRYVSRDGVSPETPRSDPEGDVSDRRVRPARSAAAVAAPRPSAGWSIAQNAITQLAEPADLRRQPERRDLLRERRQPAAKGGQDAIRRVLFNDNGEAKTLLQVIQEKNTAQGKTPATRADLRFGDGPDGQVFLLNKRDGTIRLLVPDTFKPTR